MVSDRSWPLASLALQALLASSTACAARPPSISPISPNRTGYSHPADLRIGSDRHLQGGLSVNPALTNLPGTACQSDLVTFSVTNLTRPIDQNVKNYIHTLTTYYVTVQCDRSLPRATYLRTTRWLLQFKPQQTLQLSQAATTYRDNVRNRLANRT